MSDITEYQRLRKNDLARAARAVLKASALSAPPIAPRPARKPATRPWLTALDARISVCPGCDGWCWDGKCTHNLRTAA